MKKTQDVIYSGTVGIETPLVAKQVPLFDIAFILRFSS